ncbi:vanadium-dependent haloperoxidase [Flagellimonas meishanensis]|uniref:vanadium-dependent haloperoxidase n=1 Tax=Flagellimonas meishanensis TaxID=2873264 RepID=UPI00223B0353|nr:vanadium-dependent haloperoxidase [[Muricauda] meishanensis]
MDIAVAEDGLSTLKGLRTASMAHLAMHDVLNTITPKYAQYAHNNQKSTANPIASVAYAAYTVAVDQYPDKEKELGEELNIWIANISEKEKTEARELGEMAANMLLTMRSDDGWGDEAEYAWHPMAPGVYAEFNEHSGTPEGFIFGSGWAKAKTFMLPTQDHFRSPPPPDIMSEAYTKAFNEVKELGSTESMTRTADQTHLAMWWKDFVENSHNRLARQLVEKEQLNLWEVARLFALLNITVYDAYISVFNNKFHYNHWRPYTAIRWAENDGNPDTEADTLWNNLHQHTYPFPSYPSAHGTASTAAMTILSNTLGKGDSYSFTMTTPEVDKAGLFSEKIKMDPPTRSFNSFSEAGMEASMSRVYLGIHFRYDSEEGFILGKKIGEFASQGFLKPMGQNKSGS